MATLARQRHSHHAETKKEAFWRREGMGEPLLYHSTNNRNGKVNFETALMNGAPKDYGLYTIARPDIPKLAKEQIKEMRTMDYAGVATTVLTPYLRHEIAPKNIEKLVKKAYDSSVISAGMQRISGHSYILWLTGGPTYSFKDYAGRFYGEVLEHFLTLRGERKIIPIATSGDTGPALAHSLRNRPNVDVIIFFPRDSISNEQRRQMTTLYGNVYAFEVNGDFSLCQELVKYLLKNKEFARDAFGNQDIFTSANSISIGRLLPQAIYPFYAYSRMMGDKDEPFVASIPSGNFGDMMGTIIAKEMGLPVERIICALNENRVFADFLATGRYEVRASVMSPSTAMVVRHPSNLARLVDFYGGHMYDEIDPATEKAVREGMIGRMPDMTAMKEDIIAISVRNEEHYKAMREAYLRTGTLLDPHGAVGYWALKEYLSHCPDTLSVIYETAMPGKFPLEVQKGAGIVPITPKDMREQATMAERIYPLEAEPRMTEKGMRLSDAQIVEATDMIRALNLR